MRSGNEANRLKRIESEKLSQKKRDKARMVRERRTESGGSVRNLGNSGMNSSLMAIVVGLPIMIFSLIISVLVIGFIGWMVWSVIFG